MNFTFLLYPPGEHCVKLFLQSRQQQDRYSCVSDNSCVAACRPAGLRPNAHAHSAPAQCGRPGSVSEITSGSSRSAGPGLCCTQPV